MRDFSKAISSSVERELKKHSFEKKNEFFNWEINDETRGLIALDRIPYKQKNAFGIAVGVGVINIIVQNIVSEFLGQENLKDLATISNGLSYLMPEHRWKEWAFRQSDANDSVIIDMMSAITKYGIPWMKRLSNMEAQIQELESKPWAINGSERFDLPVLYLLKGNKDRAVEFTRNVIDTTNQYQPPNVGKIFAPVFEVITPPSNHSKFAGKLLEVYEPFAKKVAEYRG